MKLTKPLYISDPVYIIDGPWTGHLGFVLEVHSFLWLWRLYRVNINDVGPVWFHPRYLRLIDLEEYVKISAQTRHNSTLLAGSRSR